MRLSIRLGRIVVALILALAVGSGIVSGQDVAPTENS